MNIQIRKSRLTEVSSSIGCYIFKEIRDKNVSHDMEWLCHICGFYNKLLDLCNNDQNIEIYVALDIDNNFAIDLAELISKYLYSEANELVDDDLEWLCEMVNVFNQLKRYVSSNTNTDTAPEIKKDTDNIDSLDEQDLKQKEEIKEVPTKTEAVPEKSNNSFFGQMPDWANYEEDQITY